VDSTDGTEYHKWLVDLKARIRGSQARAAVAVNSGMVKLYWQLGREILDRQEEQGWGAKVVEEVADRLHRELPDMKGLSRSNLMYMRRFAASWPDQQFVQQVLGQLSWYHHIALLDKVKDKNAREWYAKSAIENGWSRNVMVQQIEMNAHELA
jgi:predicted nuclease of restriction endonuclease-like (RecB) superfamily